MFRNIHFGSGARLMVVALVLFVSACTTGHDSSNDNSAGGDGSNSGSGSDTGSSTPSANDVTLIASAPSLDSAATSTDQSVTITAIVRDSNNNAVSGDTVTFSASSGLIQPVSGGQTQSNGAATAALTTGGNPANRTITVTATADSKSDTLQIPVTGTSIAIDGASAVASGETVDLTATLTDSAGDGIGNQPVDVSSTLGNTIQSNSLQTNAQGVAHFSVTGGNTGDDAIVASALGASDTASLTVGGNSLTLTTPASGARVPVGDNVAVAVKLLDSGAAVAGQTVHFASSRGSFDTSEATTDANGTATATLSASTAGAATITASTANGQNASTNIQFVATRADALALQADPATVDAGANSTLTAVVRDTNDNPVGGVTIDFNLDDSSGGSLQPAETTTDADGRASAIYTAGASSAAYPASVTATVADDASVSDTTTIVVGGQSLRIALGTSAVIATDTNGNYALPYTALVTDAAGNPISNANFQLSVQSVAYQEGTKQPDGNEYQPVYQAPPIASNFGCANEDSNHNGILDSGEDLNGNGTLDPGNVASVPRSAALNSDGAAEFNITYPKSFSGWVKVRLRATASVQGSETTQNAFFVLPAAAEDVSTSSDAPPGQISPFGMDGVCATTYDPNTGEEP